MLPVAGRAVTTSTTARRFIQCPFQARGDPRGDQQAMAYEAKKSDKFTFGLWTLGNPGRDPFGEPVRKGFTPVEMVRELSKLGAYGVNFHDNDLVPFGSGAAERDRIVREFKGALKEAGMVVPMATTNLFGHP